MKDEDDLGSVSHHLGAAYLTYRVAGCGVPRSSEVRHALLKAGELLPSLCHISINPVKSQGWSYKSIRDRGMQGKNKGVGYCYFFKFIFILIGRYDC